MRENAFIVALLVLLSFTTHGLPVLSYARKQNRLFRDTLHSEP